MFEFLQSLFVITLCWFFAVFAFGPATVTTFLSRNRLKWLARVHADHVAKYIADIISPYAEMEFTTLQVCCDSTLSNNGSFRVLEIGAGTGINFPYYPPGTHVICVDNNPYYADHLSESLKTNSHVTLERTLTTSAEDMHEIPDGIVDCVVSTYTLCAVDYVDAVLQEVIRVLKPGGYIIFIEPVLCSENSSVRLLQKIFSPLVLLYLGYHINRPLYENLNSAGFSFIRGIHLYPERLTLCVRPHISGIARK